MTSTVAEKIQKMKIEERDDTDHQPLVISFRSNDTNNKNVSRSIYVQELPEENKAYFYRNSNEIRLGRVKDNKSDGLIRELETKIKIIIPRTARAKENEERYR